MIQRLLLHFFFVFFTITLSACGGGGGDKTQSTDGTPPVITILGGSSISIVQGETYNDAGATALDDIDGNINVTSSGTVNTATAGVYSITYSATDSSGNTSTLIRTVNVLVAKVTLSGTAFDSPVIGGNISIRTLSGHEIATTTTNDEGFFSYEIESNLISSGYKLVVSGGQINGEDFTEQMNATFDRDHLEEANITAITTLIDSIAKNIDGVTEIEKRNIAIQQMESIGMVTGEDWYKIDSTYFNLFSINSRIRRAGGIGEWLILIKTDLEDNELSFEEAKSVFPLAHSGISSILTPKVSILPGNVEQISFDLSENNTQQLVLKLVQAPEWVTVNNQTLEVAPPLGLLAGEVLVEAEVSYSSDIVGRKVSIKVDVLKQVVLLEGVLGSAGGRIDNEWKDISLSVLENILLEDHALKFVLNHTSKGVLQFALHSDPLLTPEEENSLSLISPSANIIRSQYVESNLAGKASKDKQILLRNTDGLPETPFADNSVPQVCINEWDNTGYDGSRLGFFNDGNEDGFQFSAILAAKAAYFNTAELAISGAIVATEPRIVANRERGSLFKVEKCASILVAESVSRVTLPARGAPVLLVHGYANGVMANIDQYFANFPKLISDAGYKTFSFYWNTNSRFEDSANELGEAIKKINRLTGQKVHIVAHSYGGLLTRTLLQGLSEKTDGSRMINNAEFDKDFMETRIASVITVGTPHSGVFGRQTNVSFDSKEALTFNDGRDDEYGLFIEACSSLTCHEAGEEFASSLVLSTLYGVKQSPGQVVYRLAEGFLESYPNVPTKALIGLKSDGVDCDGVTLSTCNVEYTEIEENIGDGLISLAGQRFLPYSHSTKSDMLNIDNDELNVKEHLLGFDNSSFSVGDEDYLTPTIYEQIENDTVFGDGALVVTTLNLNERSNADKAVMYHHMSGEGDLDRTVDILGSNIYEWNLPILTEVGLQSCRSPEKCNHSTWNYFKYMTNTYNTNLPEEVDAASKIIASGRINYEQSTEVVARVVSLARESIQEQTMVNIYAGGELVGNTVPDEDGQFSVEVEFKSEQEYKAEVIVPASSGYRARPLPIRTTALTVEETGGLNFGLIEMVLNVFRESSLLVVLKDSRTGIELLDYTLTINNLERNSLIENRSIQSSEDSLIEGLPIGEYVVEVSKPGYVGVGQELCTVYPVVENSCVITMIPVGYVVDGGLSIVLTWNENPRDLDSHLIKFDNLGNTDCHTYYGNKRSCGVEGSLDLDDTSSYGPETIAMEQINLEGNYVYAVHHYSGSGSITTTSQAQVKVSFSDGSSRIFNAPTSGEGGYWRVFNIQNGRLLPCETNCISDSFSSPVLTRRASSSASEVPWVEEINNGLVPK